jgi:hypothetical protein
MNSNFKLTARLPLKLNWGMDINECGPLEAGRQRPSQRSAQCRKTMGRQTLQLLVKTLGVILGCQRTHLES